MLGIEAHRAPVQIRVRQDSDLDACVDLLLRVHRHDHYPARWPATPSAWLSPSRHEQAWVATDPNREVVGYVAQFSLNGHPMSDICVAATGRHEEQLAVLSRLIVDPSMRGCGIARALVEATAKHARAQGRRLVLDVAQTNGAAVATYEHLGWQRVGELGRTPTREIPVYVYVGPPSL